jgi:hypothetical protein
MVVAVVLLWGTAWAFAIGTIMLVIAIRNTFAARTLRKQRLSS